MPEETHTLGLSRKLAQLIKTGPEKTPFAFFYEMAQELFFCHQLQAGGNRYWLREIEFYYYAPTHRDGNIYQAQTGGAERQKVPNGFFCHPSGIDWTFGSGGVAGGVLIRSIQEATGTQRAIIGPRNSADQLSPTGRYYKNLPGMAERLKLLETDFKERRVFCSSRIRLSKKQDPYFYAPYRFAADLDGLNIPEKERMFFFSNLLLGEKVLPHYHLERICKEQLQNQPLLLYLQTAWPAQLKTLQARVFNPF